MPTPEIILTAAPIATTLAANAVNKSSVFGGGSGTLDTMLPTKIYATYIPIKKIYDNSGILPAANATATITVDSIGNDGDNIEVFVDDPTLGEISLGDYTKVSGDTDTTILAVHIASALNLNTHGYTITSSVNTILITARNGLGSSINGDNRLTVVINDRIFDKTFDITFN